MAKNTGSGSREGAVKNRTQLKNTLTGGYTKRDDEPGSAHRGEFMDVKQDGKFKGVAEEPDKRRK
jgi:hypothetical protein